MQLLGMTRSIKMLETVCVKRLWASQNWGAEAGCCCSHQTGGLPSRENVLRVVCFQLEHVGAVRASVHGTRTRHPLKREQEEETLLPCHTWSLPFPLCCVPSPPPPSWGQKSCSAHQGERLPLTGTFFLLPPMLPWAELKALGQSASKSKKITSKNKVCHCCSFPREACAGYSAQADCL